MRNANMIHQILSFTHKTTNEIVPLQLRHLIADLCKITKETFPSNIQTKMDLPPKLWPVSGDPTQLYQILLNLCVNARDALPCGDTISIAAENVTIDETYAR